jgi:hypothetical protein
MIKDERVLLVSKHSFDENCPGCKPVLIDATTMKPLPKDHPGMVAINRIWDECSLEEKEAFHKVTCLNNRSPSVMKLAVGLMDRFNKLMKHSEN